MATETRRVFRVSYDVDRLVSVETDMGIHDYGIEVHDPVDWLYDAQVVDLDDAATVGCLLVMLGGIQQVMWPTVSTSSSLPRCSVHWSQRECRYQSSGYTIGEAVAQALLVSWSG